MGKREEKYYLLSTGWQQMMIRVSVWKEKEMSVLRGVLEALETKGAVVASLGCLLQLLWQRSLLSCKSVESNERQMKLVFWADEKRRLRNVTLMEEGGHNGNQGLGMVAEKISQGNEPFGCWKPSKKGANSTRWVNQTPCFEWGQEGMGGSRWIGVKMRLSRQSSDCIRHVQKREEGVHVRLSELDSARGEEMWFKGLVVKLGFPHIILSDLTSSSQIWFHLNGS